MPTDRHDPVIDAFRSSYAVLVDRAPLVDDDVARLVPLRARRSPAWLALAAATVVLVAVGAAAWLVQSDRQPDRLAVGAEPFEPDLLVWLLADVTDDQLAEVRSVIDAHDAVGRVAFFSQADAYAEAQELFADDPRLLALITPDLLPPSIRFEAPREAWPELVAQLGAMDGVVSVKTGDEIRAERRRD